MAALESAELIRRHRLSVAQYERMGEAGVLAADARVELIEGELIEMAPIGTRHAAAVKRLNHAFNAALGERAVVAVQDPLRLGDYSEPQPDLMLLRPRDDFYGAAHPTAADVLLLVEVSDTTIRFDRAIKLPLYAREKIAEVWIVDLDDLVLRIHRNPADGSYRDVQDLPAPSGLVELAAFPGIVIDLGGLL